MTSSNVQYGKADTRVKIERTPQALILIFALTAMPVTTALHPTRPPITTSCQSAFYLEDIAKSAQALIATAIDNAEKATTKATKLLAVANDNTGPKALTANLLAVSLLKSAGEVLNSVKSKADVINTGAIAAAQLAGQMLAVAELSNTQIESTNFVTAASTYADGTNLQAKPKLTPNQHGTCKASATEREAHSGDPEPPTPGQNKIVLIGIKTRTMPAKAANAELTLCGSTAHSNNDPYDSSHQCTSAQGTVLALKGGKIYETAKITITRKEGGAENKYTASNENTATPNKKTIAAAAAAIAQLEEAASAIAAVSAPLDIKPLITAPRLKEQLAKAIDGEGAKYADATKTKVDNLLKEAIGEDGEEIKNTVEKSLEELTPSKAAVGGNGDRQLKAITVPQEISDAATYYAVRRFIKEKEEKKKNQASHSCPTKTDKSEDPPKTVDECKKHLTEKPCKDEKGCDFDDKKPEGERSFLKVENDKKDEKSFSNNLRVSVHQVFAAFVIFVVS